MMATSVTAVIPVWNGRELLEQLLKSIAAQTKPFAEVVAVDNGSNDGAPEAAKSRGCRVFSMGYNAGFARAVNRGCQEAASEWVAVLNSDVVLEPDWLAQCLAHAGTSAFVVGKLLQSSNALFVDGTYDLLSRAGCAWRAGNGERDRPEDIIRPIVLAPATATLYRTEYFRSIGGFDETFESYLEDVDLSLRFAKQGCTGIYVPAARAVHKGNAALGAWSSRVVRLIARNQLLLLTRHYDRALVRAWLWPILAGQFLWGVLAFRHGRGLAWIRGKWEGIRQFRLTAEPVPPGLRRIIEQSEHEIQVRSQDWYWRWYFRLTGAS